MLYEMKLEPQPFKQIANGTKTIELRVNDEKRRKLRIGDVIEFTLKGSSDKIRVVVNNLYVFSSFEELYVELPLLKCGYTKENVDQANPKDMIEYYSYDEQYQNGVVGIEIMLEGQVSHEL